MYSLDKSVIFLIVLSVMSTSLEFSLAVKYGSDKSSSLIDDQMENEDGEDYEEGDLDDDSGIDEEYDDFENDDYEEDDGGDYDYDYEKQNENEENL